MIITGIIPARYASTRLPGKPLIDIAGKPMIQRVYEQVSKSKLINDVIVATDNKRIFDCVIKFGGTAIMTSVKHKTGTDRLCEAAGNIKSNIIVNIQGDEPFIDYRNIDRAIQPLIDDSRLNVSTLAIKIKDKKEIEDPNEVKVVFDNNFNALYFSRSVVPFNRDSDIQPVYYKHIGLYVFKKKYLLKFGKTRQTKLENTEKLEQLRILETGERIRVVITNKDSVSIDTLYDLQKVLRTK